MLRSITISLPVAGVTCSMAFANVRTPT